MGKRNLESTYERWIKQEGVPIFRGYGLDDVQTVRLGPWKRLGGQGAFIQLIGMEGLTGLYVGEIPPGGALSAERHLYDELIYILDGRGATEVWSGPKEKFTTQQTHFFEWQAGSLFSPPINTWHRLINGSGSEPVRFLGATNAPMVMDLYHNTDFIMGCDYQFSDRYNGDPDYFKRGRRWFDEDTERPEMNIWVWETNFIPDVRAASVDALESKGAGVSTTQLEISGNVLVGHISEMPVGRYHKAHYHAGGNNLLVLRGQGYTLMWPQEAGARPYENGRSERVVRRDWREGSLLCPPGGWFHQHFNVSAEPVRQLALRFGSWKYGMGFWDASVRDGLLVSVKKGGTLIDDEDEDPEIRRQYMKELAAAGVNAASLR